MKKHLLLYLCFIAYFFCLNIVYAKKVEIKDAKNVAINFYIEHSSRVISPKSVIITEDYTVKEESAEMYYVFNFNLDGFVIVAADDAVHPVLAYSYEKPYSDKDISPEFAYWMNNYKNQIKYIINNKLSSTVGIIAEWTHLNAPPTNFNSEKEINTVGPLLLSTWDQGQCYNSLCPEDPQGSGGHVWVGCVATAMAQLMYYYRYPETGQGSHSYNSPYGYLSANFGATTYDWNAMTNSCMNYNSEIAKLSSHLGISVNMNYNINGSGASTWDAANSLVDYFKYSPAIQSDYKNNYSETDWKNILINEFDNSRPVLYVGYEPNYSSGHAFVCDGYQGTDYFHFNWGWSGHYDGFFYLNNLNPGYNFTLDQMAVYNIFPADNYPLFCSGSKNLTTETGTIEDGSGPNNYQNNSDCSWLISPVGADHINLSFNYFNTEESNDVLVVYDGPDASAPVIGTFSGSTLPSDISSTASTMFIKFTSNATINSTGWMATYITTYANYCSGVTTFTAPSDTFSDGSGIYDYISNTDCRWSLEPSNAATVTLHFTDFNTEPEKDKIRIVDPISSIYLATYSGSSIPADITSYSGQLYIIFSTNSFNNASGWKAYYTSTPLGVTNNDLQNKLTVFPNPAHDKLNISFNLTGKQKVELQFIDITGQVVYSTITNITGVFNKNIDISSLAKGAYLLKVVTSENVITKKFFID